MDAFIINMIRELEIAARNGEDKAQLIALAEELMIELKKLPLAGPEIIQMPDPENTAIQNLKPFSYVVPKPPAVIRTEPAAEQITNAVSDPKDSVQQPTGGSGEPPANMEEIAENEERLTRQPPRYIESDFVSKIKPEEFKPEPVDPSSVSEEFVLPVTAEMIREALQEINVPETLKPGDTNFAPKIDGSTERPAAPSPGGQTEKELTNNKPVSQPAAKAPKKELNDTFLHNASTGIGKFSIVPVQDLRRAFTIGEKYQLVEELFGGDDVLFERSLEAIEQSSALPQAIFFIERELRVKMGWQEDKPSVQFFYDTVRRRFS